MSKENGWAAINLEMPERIPRTEYSAHFHWDLVRKVTGIDVDQNSDAQTQQRASDAFLKAWDYGFMWNIWAHSHNCFGDFYTKMGHASYAAGGVDFSAEVSCPFSDPEEVLAFRPTEKFGKIDKADVLRQINEDYRFNCEHYSDTVCMTGTYISCFSGLIELFGWEMLLLAAGTDADGFGKVAEDYGKFIMQYFEVLSVCDSPVIMIHDDLCWTSGPVVAPEWYRRYVFPFFKKATALLRDCGKKVLFTSDGDYSVFIDDLAKCGMQGFVLEPTTDMRSMAEKYGKTHVIVGNADTRVLLSGSKDDIEREVKRCIDIGKNCPGYFLAVGNHIPPNTPVENALYYDEMYRKYAKR